VQLLAIRCVVATWLWLHNAPFYAQEVQTTWFRNPIENCLQPSALRLWRNVRSPPLAREMDDIASAVDRTSAKASVRSASGFQTHRRIHKSDPGIP
jgi:hypothetical protein